MEFMKTARIPMYCLWVPRLFVDLWITGDDHNFLTFLSQQKKIKNHYIFTSSDNNSQLFFYYASIVSFTARNREVLFSKGMCTGKGEKVMWIFYLDEVGWRNRRRYTDRCGHKRPTSAANRGLMSLILLFKRRPQKSKFSSVYES